MTAITIRDARILFSTTSVPTNCKPAASRFACFFTLGVQALPPYLHRTVDPQWAALFVGHPCVSPILTFPGVAGFIHQRRDLFMHGTTDFNQGLARFSKEALTHHPGELQSGSARD
ncbi:MAG: hypothetical protein IPG23_27165 [Burkholderiales bacterium]|nr:hypothetical protein [Burkholderiales bacterium]